MIFHTIGELHEISELRRAVSDKKLEYYKQFFPEKHWKIDQVEFEMLEVIERARRFRPIPYIDVEEIGDGVSSRDKAKLHPDIFCTFNEIGDYRIAYNWDLAFYIGRYIGYIFGENPSEYKVEWYKQKGIPYRVFEKPIYSFPVFEKLKDCKIQLLEFAQKMAIWFITLHEIGHINNGHLDYKEEMKSSGEPVETDIARAMELHADIFASELMLKIMKSWSIHIGEIILTEHGRWNKAGVTYFDEIVLAAVSAYISLRCFLKEKKWDEYTIGIHELTNKDHPLTELRMAIVFNVFLQGLMDLGENEIEKYHLANSFVGAITDFEEFWFSNSDEDNEDQKIFYRPTELLRTKKGKAYYSRIFEALLELNSFLPKYASGYCRIEGTWSDYNTLPERMFWSN